MLTPFQVDVSSLHQAAKKVVCCTGLSVHIDSSGVLSVCYKTFSWCVKGGHKQHVFSQHDLPFKNYNSVANTNSKNKHC